MGRLDGRRALVTGGSRGIGRALVESLRNEGARVAFCGRTPGDVDALSGALGGGDDVVGLVCDVSDPEACARFVATAATRLGGVDILVNNAGLGILKGMEELTIEEWQLQIDVNLGGVFYCSKAALPHLRESGDAWIVNIGSLASRNPFAGGTGYNASKFGLLGMTEAMMLELRYEPIRVSIVMPGSVATGFGGREEDTGSDWRISSEEVARSVIDLLAYPGNAHVSRVEMRPSRPPRR